MVLYSKPFQKRFMTPMPWFRMYSEFASDPKVQTMSETFQRRFVMLLCMQCGGQLETSVKRDETQVKRDIAFQLRISDVDVTETLAEFERRELTDGVKIVSWNKRQFKSDVSTPRVKKFRQQKRNVSRNVAVAPSESDTEQNRADTEKKLPTEVVERSAPDPVPRGTVERVFDHWREVHGHTRAALDDKRRKLIRLALGRGHGEADLCQAISGYKNSPHHMGQNKHATVYDDIEVMIRDSKHVEAGLKFYAQPPRTDLSATTRRNIAATADWQPPELRNGN